MTQPKPGEKMSQLLTTREDLLLWNTQGYHAKDGAVNAEDLLDQAGLNWDVGLVDLYSKRGKGYETIGRRKGIARGDTGQILGVAKSRYVPIPNREMLAFLDNLQDSGEALYEAAWYARDGETVGVTMRLADEVQIAGMDPHAVYLLATTTHDGGGSVRIDATPVRLSCTNMVSLAKRQAVRTYRATHTKSLDHRVMEAREALKVVYSYVDAYEKLAEKLLTQPVRAKQVKTWATDLFGEKHANDVVTFWSTRENLEAIRNTRFGAVNALTDYAQHVRPRHPSVESMVRGALNRTTEKAYELVAS